MSGDGNFEVKLLKSAISKLKNLYMKMYAPLDAVVGTGSDWIKAEAI